MGRHLHSADQQRSQPHLVHADHAALQRDTAAGVVQLQTAETPHQQPPGSSAFLYVAGNVASARKQPNPLHTSIRNV